ncbi:MAG: hypothetical protein JSV85_01535 [Candidatus Bathyarchaeota archaeon]|nr:MAG: hypothetical protein JSV85_01535 [Candidatus Bathyarchaeota archaeon]
MNAKCVLVVSTGLILVSMIFHSAGADDIYIDALVDPINIMVSSPREVIVGENFNITVGVLALQNLTLNDLWVKVEDKHHSTVSEDTLFTDRDVQASQAQIEETFSTSLTIKGEYYFLVHFTYTVESEQQATSKILAKMGFVRDVSYDDLETNYNLLSSEYSALDTQFLSLQQDYDSVSNQITFFQLSSVLSMIAAVVLAATTLTFWLAKRRKS